MVETSQKLVQFSDALKLVSFVVGRYLERKKASDRPWTDWRKHRVVVSTTRTELPSFFNLVVCLRSPSHLDPLTWLFLLQLPGEFRQSHNAALFPQVRELFSAGSYS